MKRGVTAGSKDLPVAGHLPGSPHHLLLDPPRSSSSRHGVCSQCLLPVGWDMGLEGVHMAWEHLPHLKCTGKEEWSCRCGVHWDWLSC